MNEITPLQHHKHSLLMFIVSGIFIVTALAGTGYYLYKMHVISTPSTVAIHTTAAPTATPTETPSPTPTATAVPTATPDVKTSSAAISQDIAAVNVSDIKTAVTQLKAALASFSN
jgi:hypothetical protein